MNIQSLVITTAVAAVIGGIIGWNVNGWRWSSKYDTLRSSVENEARQAAEQAREVITESYTARLAREIQLRKDAEEVSAIRMGEIEALQEDEERVRIIYRDAIETDPSCADWAIESIRCPISSLQ